MSNFNFSISGPSSHYLHKEKLFDCKENESKSISDYFWDKQEKMLREINKVQLYLDSRSLEPFPTGNETNGSYYLSLLDMKGTPKLHGVYKPSLQSRGALDRSEKSQTRKGIPPGSQSFRERLGYALQEELHHCLKGLDIPSLKPLIPTTLLAEIKHDSFGENHRIGSYQRYKRERISLGDVSENELKFVPVEEFLMLALIDSLLLNTDRHLGNILFAKEPKPQSSILTLIDQGECFPEISSLQDISLDWRYLPFTKNPFPPAWIELINQLNIGELTKRILFELKEAKFTKQEKSTLGISGEAIAVFIYAVASLKHFVYHYPKKPISRYVEYLSKHSQFCTEIKDPAAQCGKRLIRLDALTPQGAAKEFRNKFGEIEDIEIKRRNFGGQFVKGCTSYWKDVKKFVFKGKQPSPEEVFKSLDRLNEIAIEKLQEESK